MSRFSVRDALQSGRAQIGAFEARLLLRYVLDVSTGWLLAHDEIPLSFEQQRDYLLLVERRRKGEPIAYLLGTREFYGRIFKVTPDTLIPRHETELLVERVLADWKGREGLKVLDLGTGSGILAVTLALELQGAEVHAVDASQAALSIASENANFLGAKVHIVGSHWFNSLECEKFDVIVSNPPYIGENDPHLQKGDVCFEPSSALVSGAEGLDDLTHIIQTAPQHLKAGGRLYLEHGYDQAPRVRALFESLGFQELTVWQDLAGIERVSVGKWLG